MSNSIYLAAIIKENGPSLADPAPANARTTVQAMMKCAVRLPPGKVTCWLSQASPAPKLFGANDLTPHSLLYQLVENKQCTGAGGLPWYGGVAVAMARPTAILALFQYFIISKRTLFLGIAIFGEEVAWYRRRSLQPALWPHHHLPQSHHVPPAARPHPAGPGVQDSRRGAGGHRQGIGHDPYRHPGGAGAVPAPERGQVALHAHAG